MRLECGNPLCRAVLAQQGSRAGGHCERCEIALCCDCGELGPDGHYTCPYCFRSLAPLPEVQAGYVDEIAQAVRWRLAAGRTGKQEPWALCLGCGLRDHFGTVAELPSKRCPCCGAWSWLTPDGTQHAGPEAQDIGAAVTQVVGRIATELGEVIRHAKGDPVAGRVRLKDHVLSHVYAYRRFGLLRRVREVDASLAATVLEALEEGKE